ncbi:hypothetical protein JCM4814A_73720 [Streptomyces phaeofaciens JCM 4814]|uniref:Uncharacterized protein n=1 Tax=Streptomyces phaeofaciens TaxID=68254 RepID=A0A918HHA3_9ACTN|nr:hypothetical protein GCM10010226_46180 [Streptomyces phaeofaciens]
MELGRPAGRTIGGLPVPGAVPLTSHAESRCLSLLDMDMPKSDDYARTSVRLTMWGCLAGLAVALAVPVYMVVAVLLGGMPTP